MIRYLSFVFVCLLGACSLQAQLALPELTIKEQGRRQNLDLRELSVVVRMEGLWVETVLELEFYNHSSRQQEGEFVLQLPEGATVSTYALEVKGKMRPGVAVEKNKARNAYESIKRRRIDPGLVEREAGNIYRTRIFPIEPEKTKRVRIGFIQQVAEDGKYVFPLHRAEALEKFSCEVRGAVFAPKLSSEGLADEPRELSPGVWKWDAGNVTLEGKLIAHSQVPKAGRPLVRIDRQPDGTAHFLVQGKSPDVDKGKFAKKWKKIRLIWDTSYSRRWQKHAEEFAALRRILEWRGECEVSLQLLGNSLGEIRNFQIEKDGKAGKELEGVLRGISYDGAADFSKIGPWDGITLLMTDGEVSSPIWTLGNKRENFYLFTAMADQLDRGLEGLATEWIDLRSKAWWDRLTQASMAIQVEGGEDESIGLSAKRSFFSISGRIPAGFEGNFIIRSAQDEVIVSVPVYLISEEQEEWNFSRRVWAQKRLRNLEKEGDRQVITAFAESERLVSDFTSLIVLESFEDHVRYRIPPPEPDLLTKYQQRMGRETDFVKIRASRWWDSKIAWYKKPYPWVDGKLEEEILAVSIWVKSTLEVFPEAKLNKKALNPYQQWLPDARQIVAAKGGLKTAKDYNNWIIQVDKKVEDLDKMRHSPIASDPGQLIHVSVRGFVNEHGFYSSGDPFFLSQAIKKSGGPNVFGSLSRVYLYRAAQRTGYNLESAQYTNVNLQWGDMIVVESPLPPSHFSGDYFSDPFSAPASAAAGGFSDAVFERAGEHMSSSSQSESARWARPFGSRRAEPEGEQYLEGRADAWKARGKAKGIDEGVLQSLRDHQEPENFYRELLKGKFGKDSVSMATIIEIARFFFKRKQPVIAERVLSTLCEFHSNPVEATRAYAYWLAELGEAARAIEVLEKLAKVAPDENTRALIYFDLGQVSDKADFFRQAVETGMASGKVGTLSNVALTDYFGRGGAAVKGLADFNENALPSDVRIVITSIGDSVKEEITHPPGYVEKMDYGDRISNSLRVFEYQIRRALPGAYKVSIKREEWDIVPLTVQVTVYTRWASGKQVKKTQTLLMEGQEIEVDDVVFAWGE